MGTVVKLLVGVALVLLGPSPDPPTAPHRVHAVARNRPPSHLPADSPPFRITPKLNALRVSSSHLDVTAPDRAVKRPPPLWGRRFVVARLGAERNRVAVAYVLAARATRLRYVTSAGAAWATVRAGDVLPVALPPAHAAAVFAASDVAVYYFHAGASPFMAAVAPLGKFCRSYLIRVRPGATVVLVTTDIAADVAVDGRPLGGGGWRRLPGGEFWWREVAMGDAGGYRRLRRADGTFAVLSYGVGWGDGDAGSRAVCECDNPDPCRGFFCRPGERRRVSSCRPRCDAVADATCRLRAGVRTFRGVAFALPGPRRYVVTRICNPDPSLPDFSVEATVLAAGVASLFVRVYDVTVAAVRGEEGLVQVNNRSFSLPVALHGARVLAARRGAALLLETDFSLRVSYDWRGAVNVTVPGAFADDLCGVCGDAGGDFASSDGTESDRELLGRGKLFGVCRGVLDPWGYLEACTGEPCNNESVCRALEKYAAACKERGVQLPDWRKEEGCAPRCPENSRYNPCGCPRTCTHLDGPENCSTPCQETCECVQGFALLNGSCAAAAVACGCHHAGHRYAPGEQFWEGDGCTRSCVCDPEVQRVRCKKDGCRRGQRCAVEKGVTGCYPESYRTCSSGRDKNYVTYDGQRYNFAGSCLYEFTRVCEASKGLVGFQVLVQNKGQGLYGSTFTRSVQVIVYGYNVTFSHNFRGKVMVDGLLVNLPHILPEGKIFIVRRGWGTSLRTDFNLTVSFDGRSHLAVTVPSAYAGALCGLCGNFDGDPHNDVPEVVTTVVPGCSGPTPHRCSNRAIINHKQRASEEDCGLILWSKGPFRSCHSRVDPESYFQACITDYCIFRGHKAIICQAVMGYAAACQEAGVVLEPWRSKTFCAPFCPPHSHYELHGTACPATCGHPNCSETCNLPRTEGCFCDEGFVLSGERCVPPPDCGCHHQGRYYQRGEEFYPEDGCAERCRCTANGTVTCWAAPCSSGEECRVERGVRGCHGGQRGRCVLLSSRRLVTFDGLNFTLGGSCRYVLAKVCQGDGHELEVTLENGGGVAVAVGSSRITMQSGSSWRVDVDGETRTLPLSLDDGKTWVTQEGNNIVLQMALGHRLVYAATAILLVTVPSTYAGRMSGLCGDFDGNSDNDFMGPNGTRVKGTQELVVAWKVPDESITCSDICEMCVVHPPDATRPYHAENSCGMMVVTSGPFSSCHVQVGPEDFFEHCLQEMVLTAGAMDTLCRSLQAYTAACQEAGATVKVWRTKSFCPLPCGEHSFYTLCARSCEGSCARIAQPLPCHGPCFEGCRCTQGFFTDGDGCIFSSTCGCFQDGRYTQVLENFLVDNCSRNCTCYLYGALICDDGHCSPGGECGVQGGRRICLPP
ncbi:IgGFc-binding protein-like [Grus americana]|uniref:IgGFc-binding protein-like n=1 Tax=Grus americana TaxID=9117 RepID=UPI002408384A|nr:IgGFc-binding protein-like [Grus americana]